MFFGIGSLTLGAQPAPVPAPTLNPNTIPKFVGQLVIPPAYSPTVITDPVTGAVVRHDYTVSMERFQEQILPLPFPQTTVFGYAGLVQTPGGPVQFQNSPSATFEAVKGIPVRINWVNNLTGSQLLPVDPTIMWADPNNMGIPAAPFATWPPGYAQAQSPIPTVPHLHGGEVRSDSDGGPEAWFTSTGQQGPKSSGQTFNYPNQQNPTTLWYHDHALGVTRINVLSGLAGFYLLRDPADPVAASLPSGQYEVPLAIQDRSFNADGSLFFPSVGINPTIHPYWMPEFFGNAIMVNGKTWPNFNVQPQQYRFRVLNGSNARFYNLSLSNMKSFTQIGTDGGYLPTPVVTKSLLIAPGERADILIDFSAVPAGTKIVLNNDAKAPYPRGTVPDKNTGQIMQFTVQAGIPVLPAQLPAALNTIPVLTPNSPTKTLTLNEVMGPAGPTQVLLNGQSYSAPVSENSRVGATEDWEIVNTTADTHPIHLHLVQFQVVNRQAFNLSKYMTDWTALNGAVLPLNPPTTVLPTSP